MQQLSERPPENNFNFSVCMYVCRVNKVDLNIYSLCVYVNWEGVSLHMTSTQGRFSVKVGN